MEEENLKSNPLYKNVLDYLSKPRPEIPLSTSFIRRLFLKKIIFWVTIFLGVVVVIGILMIGYNYLINIKSAPVQNTALTSTLKPKVVCKLFNTFEEALKDIDIACILKLEGQGLTRLPPDITKLTKLNELSLKNNNLATFPTEILSMPTLITLDLSNNQISYIPSEIANLKNLQSLKLTGNNLSEEEKVKVKKLFPYLSIVF